MVPLQAHVTIKINVSQLQTCLQTVFWGTNPVTRQAVPPCQQTTWFSTSLLPRVAAKLHQYFIPGGIFLRADSMGEEINSGGINNAARWHWPYFAPFNLRWYFDARCPAVLKHMGGFILIVQSLEREKKDSSCLTEVTSLPKPIQRH